MFAKARIMQFSILVSLLTTVMGAAGVLPALSKGQPNGAPAASQMLQFTSSRHVLGFQTSCVYVATGTYMLQESFADTKGAAPQAERPPTEYGRAQPLGKVTYSELWPGITLIYDSPPGGILRSTFQVEPGADPGQISLG